MEASSKLFFVIAGLLVLLYAIYQLAIVIINKNKIKHIDGIIVKVRTAVPETMKKHNSKWAIVSYEVDGKTITSRNEIQVSMYDKIGDRIQIAYFINNPEKLFTATLEKSFIFFLAAVILLVVGIIK